ncbi:hypothetical protein O6H91_11G051800 [Diphasiastrum complanatum]|uniref:Uncharacterized protein n=2 Tax=Diphasiastrum complanatum TaxID=34168 RepID=A0ACC2C9H0_DIPCM|nr:hypothetical protein O6H91_11G051800 [Diphasiastrum complanatum]KAJ7538510.1 hypothetical protein O6H91_11G051800 [Diphasiastrum complanatum]
MGAGWMDLEDQYAFYGAYHSNKVNVLIHTLLVWPIIFTVIALAAYTPALGSLPLRDDSLPLQQYMVLNCSFVISAFYALYYTAIDQKAGILAGAMCMLCWVGGNAFAQSTEFSFGWKIVIIAQIICWTGQFIGHGIYERRAPAFCDNFFQAFLTGPYFVLLKVLHSAFGYEPYPGFWNNVSVKLSANLVQYHSSKRTSKSS